MKSHLAIHDFIESNGIQTDEFGNVKFKAKISYSSPKRDSNCVTDISIVRNGYNDGDIELTEVSDLPALDFHLGFNVRLQNYECTNRKLSVSGKSPKMGGNYLVVIQAL